eukprot:TRINITY_DN40383_c0_g1_i1.p1 TRINITY_DN40383_c0_g1~~TRINITY_DN40383_c0_g1_i1.p1  ORF type:complete len:319 (+),score=35.25 TRINITY_DN40383_c0_g1_i1:209-1165(+)
MLFDRHDSMFQNRGQAQASQHRVFRQRLRRGRRGPKLASAVAVACTLAFVLDLVNNRVVNELVPLPWTAKDSEAPTPKTQRAHLSLADVMDEVLNDVKPLRAQVEDGQIIAGFGDKADNIILSLRARFGNIGAAIETAVDRMLYALFLQQLTLVRLEVASKHDKLGGNITDVVSQADRAFVSQSLELKRPGSTWSFEQERYALRAMLEGSSRQDVVLGEEQAVAAQTQQRSIEIVRKLQSQMEALQQDVQRMRAGSPWVVSTSYRIPKTPLTLIGRYQQGRANIELSLSPDKDPINADVGFVQGAGPANVAVNLNVGT